ncbi:DUF2905 domain-containing protein [Candidatus Woesearchaeota archaeon]|nr:DUF2905 domain-containing protein [Candidatus Woesearchaeota archaeon]
MEPLAQMLVIAGAFLIVTGLVWAYAGKSIGLVRLPGDIAIEKGNFRFYFPLGTSIAASIILALLFWIFRHFR